MYITVVLRATAKRPTVEAEDMKGFTAKKVVGAKAHYLKERI